MRRFMSEDRVSNKLSRTAFIASTSFGRQISHIARAKAIWIQVSRNVRRKALNDETYIWSLDKLKDDSI